jgi:CMP/dCMP kinase
MIITISGTPGSGKSSIAKAVAKRLNYRFYSAGDVRGQYALEHGLTIDELNKLAEKDPASDLLVDEYMKKMGAKEDDIVVDGRLGFYFIPDSIKVFIDADADVRIERVLKSAREDEHYKSFNEAKKAIQQRIDGDKNRYKHSYNVDISETKHYDLIVDSTDKSIEAAAGEIYRFVMFRIHNSHKK